MIFFRLVLPVLGLLLQPVFSAAINAGSVSTTPQSGAEHDFAPAAFTDMMPRPDLVSIPCFACLMEECPEVRRYPGNITIWTKCNVRGMLYPKLLDPWAETVDGCYIMHSEFNYYPHDAKRAIAALPVCDEDKAHQMPNSTRPHAEKRQVPDPVPTYTPVIIDPRHDKKCLVCADPLCNIETTYKRNSTVDLECWTVSTMGPGEVISFPTYDERWVMTKDGCYLALSEVSTPCPGVANGVDCMEYCEPPPHYWAPVKDRSLARGCANNCSLPTGWIEKIYVVDFDCWDYGDTVQGNNTWYKGIPWDYLTNSYTIWWPKASLGPFGGTGEPTERCIPDANSTKLIETKARPIARGTDQHQVERVDETTAIGHAAPRAVQVVYASVNTVDTRCRLCTKRICPYYTVYQPGENMDFTCFVYGSVIDGSDVWYKSGESTRCYVPQRYVTINGGASISYCRDDTRRSISSSDTVVEDNRPATIAQRAPAPQVSDPSQSPDPPNQDSCQKDTGYWEQWCYNQALSCCVSQTPVELFWDCTAQLNTDRWKRACHDLATRTECTAARRLGNIMEGCESGNA